MFTKVDIPSYKVSFNISELLYKRFVLSHNALDF